MKSAVPTAMPGAGELAAGRALLRDAEVGQEHALARPVAFDQDVAGLDVTVDEAVAVRLVERAGDLRDHGHRVPGVEAALLGQQGAQIGALDEAHRHVQPVALLPGVVDRHHVRMLERGGDPALALEAGAELGVTGDARRDQLQRDPAIERQIGRAVHDAHAAAAGDALDAMTGKLRAGPELGRRACGEAAAEAGIEVGPAAGDGSDRVDELVLGALLEHVAARAGGQCAAGEERIALHREHDDRGARRGLEEARDRGERRVAGHVEIQDDDARAPLVGRAQRAVTSPASATTVRPGSESSSIRSPRRTIVWSSARTISIPLPGSSSEWATMAPLYRRVRGKPAARRRRTTLAAATRAA